MHAYSTQKRYIIDLTNALHTDLQILLHNHSDLYKSLAEDFRHQIDHIVVSSQSLRVLQMHCLLLCTTEKEHMMHYNAT